MKKTPRKVGRPRKYPKGHYHHTTMSVSLEINERFISYKEAYETTLGIKLSRPQFLQTLLNKWDG